MSVSIIHMICNYNENLLKTETKVKYEENIAVIVPFDVYRCNVDCTCEQFGDIIYSRTTIDKQMFKLVFNCNGACFHRYWAGAS